jgi:hypothetical protein
MTVLGLQNDPMLLHYGVRVQVCLIEAKGGDVSCSCKEWPLAYCSWEFLLRPLRVIPTPAFDEFQRVLFSIFIR